MADKKYMVEYKFVNSLGQEVTDTMSDNGNGMSEVDAEHVASEMRFQSVVDAYDVRVLELAPETYGIDDLSVGAWQNAIRNICEALNGTLGTGYEATGDWVRLQASAIRLGLRFDADGKIVSWVA